MATAVHAAIAHETIALTVASLQSNWGVSSNQKAKIHKCIVTKKEVSK
jgi:hypothetical protein